MRNDWRTDNWAGHYPVQVDERSYKFARHLREFNHYASYNFDGYDSVEDVPVWKTIIFLLFLIVVLDNLNLIIDILTNLREYYTIWVDSLLDLTHNLDK